MSLFRDHLVFGIPLPRLIERFNTEFVVDEKSQLCESFAGMTDLAADRKRRTAAR